MKPDVGALIFFLAHVGLWSCDGVAWYAVGGRGYVVPEDLVRYDSISSACTTLGGETAVFRNNSEFEAVRNRMSANPELEHFRVWIAITRDIVPATKWMWSEEEVNSSLWWSTHPNWAGSGCDVTGSCGQWLVAMSRYSEVTGDSEVEWSPLHLLLDVCCDDYNLALCQDVDECDQASANCTDNSVCVNTFGSYSCHCINGYTTTEDGVCKFFPRKPQILSGSNSTLASTQSDSIQTSGSSVTLKCWSSGIMTLAEPHQYTWTYEDKEGQSVEMIGLRQEIFTINEMSDENPTVKCQVEAEGMASPESASVLIVWLDDEGDSSTMIMPSSTTIMPPSDYQDYIQSTSPSLESEITSSSLKTIVSTDTVLFSTNTDVNLVTIATTNTLPTADTTAVDYTSTQPFNVTYNISTSTLSPNTTVNQTNEHCSPACSEHGTCVNQLSPTSSSKDVSTVFQSNVNDSSDNSSYANDSSTVTLYTDPTPTTQEDIWLCECDEGFVMNQTSEICEDPCVPGCPDNSACIDLSESNQSNATSSLFNQSDVWICECDEGFVLSNETGLCDDVDECLLEDTCTENEDCTNKDGGFTCQCRGGLRCTDVGNCTATPSFCREHSQCVASVCVCEAGYVSEGYGICISEELLSSTCSPPGKPEYFTGTQTSTSSGIPCQAWAHQSPHTHTYGDLPDDFVGGVVGGDMPGNMCRHPIDDNFPTPWCYTTDPDTRYEACGIPDCIIATTPSTDSSAVAATGTGFAARPVPNLCACNCLVTSKTSITAAEDSAKIQKHLALDAQEVAALSATRRRKSSSQDNRISSTATGTLAIAMLVVVLMLITFNDLTSFMRWFRVTCTK